MVSALQSVPGDMVGCGFHFELLVSLCKPTFFILGLVLAHYTTLSCHVEEGTDYCSSSNISSKYLHCEVRPGGVQDLDCFMIYIRHNYGAGKCVWTPGNHTRKKTYTLIIQQERRNYCRVYNNMTEPCTTVEFFQTHMSVEVYENSESENCTKAVFRASSNNLRRCGPPSNVAFRRHSGKLDVNVSWREYEKKHIASYSVRYTARSSLSLNKSLVLSQNRERCGVDNVNSSLVYVVQIQCVINDKCSQCPWSEPYTIPSELTTRPVIDKYKHCDIAGEKGLRLLTLTWTFPTKEPYDGYYVTVKKASGEDPPLEVNTTRPEIRLNLSYSAYHLSVSAVNNVSISPATSKTIPQREDVPGDGEGRLNVTVHSNTSFTIYWKDNLIRTYVCYCVEWWQKGQKAAYKSFYQDRNNYMKLPRLAEPLEPYKRYSISLHTRPNKQTCKLKHINNSESTYGSTQFYFTEGSPVSAPVNISSYNVTQNSLVLEWSPMPEEDVRGFLLGYTIHYTEYHNRGTETNVTVDPMSNSRELGDLKSGTVYQVQISGFTQAGAGVRSTPRLFKTNQGYFSVNISVPIAVLAVISILLIFGPSIIKRAKLIVWPSLPDPGSSKAMQKMERPELELLESINTLKVEEWDTHSFHLVEKETVVSASTSPFLCALEDEGDSPEMTCNRSQRDAEGPPADVLPDDTTETLSNIPHTNIQTLPFAFSSEYTTMEMFHQAMPQPVPANTVVSQVVENEPENIESAAVKSRLDYIEQFSPTLVCQEMPTMYK
uniref:interleukin-6 receptor subunit beta isoform X2 n=1 Tax=Monopterus albus TaxID=43700 RepID=UPI0009B377E1|nr:interleukin-6 receptor subunit beta-like isoform X2 [Monopterus albus]